MSRAGRFLNFLRSLSRKRRIEAFKSVAIRTTWITATITLLLALFIVLLVVPAVYWLPEASEAVPLLGTLLTAQAAIAALTLAVTLFVMQGIGSRGEVDDRMYRAYIRRSWVRYIFWMSIIAVGVTGATLLTAEFISRVGAVADYVPGIPNLTLFAVVAFIANLVLAGVLFQRSIHLAHPAQWSTLRRDVNERDVREAIHAFLRRLQTARSALESNKRDLSSVFPGPDEGSADESIRALLDNALGAMTERRQMEFQTSLNSIRELVTYAMDELESMGIKWGPPGPQPQWPPLRELGRNLYSFREEVIREGNRDYAVELLRLDYWLASTGMRRQCGELFTAGLDGYRKNYQIANRIGGGELRELFRDRFSTVANGLTHSTAPREAFPYTIEMVKLQERLLSDAMHAGRPDDYVELNRGFRRWLRFIRLLWERESWASPESTKLYEKLEQDYRIALMGLAGRSISLADSGGIANADPYLNMAREAYSRLGPLTDDVSQALMRDGRLGFSLWSEWEMEGSFGEARLMSTEQYPLTFFTVRLMELVVNQTPALDLHGSAKQVLGWFITNSERLEKNVSVEPAATGEQRRELATDTLWAAVRRDEVAEDYEIIGRAISADSVSDFKSDVYAAAFAENPVERLFERAGAFSYLSADAAGGPAERSLHHLYLKAFLADSPENVRNFYAPLDGAPLGQGFGDDVLKLLCDALDHAPHISALPGISELLKAIDNAIAELNPSGEIALVLAGDWSIIEFALTTAEPGKYVPARQLSDDERIGEIGRYRGHPVLRGPAGGGQRVYVLEPGTWGCFVHAQLEGDQDLRIQVSPVSLERAQELLEANPCYFASEPDQESKLRKLQTCVEISIGARAGFRVIDSTRARRVIDAH